MEVINPHRFPVSAPPAVDFDGFGNASRYFDGTDQVTITDDPSFPTGSQTFACWVKFDVIGTFQDLMLHWAGSIDQASIALVRNTDNKLRFYIDPDGLASTANTFVASATSLQADQWYHVAGVFESGSALRVYVNGSLDGSLTSGIAASVHNSTAPFTLGNRTDASFGLAGSMCDCRLYDAALDATTIANLYGGENITTNLVGHWLKDTPSLLDHSGTNDGTNEGSAFAYDNPSPDVEFGKASRSFDRSLVQYVSVADSATFPTGAQTHACWFKPDATSSGGQSIIGKWGNGGNLSFLLYYLNANLGAYISGDGSSVINTPTYSISPSTGTWHHAAFVFVPSTSLTLYVNGSQVGQTTSGVPATLYDSSAEYRIGRMDRSYSAPFGGHVCDVRMYDADLSSTDITALYNGTNVETNLIGHWLTNTDDVNDYAGSNDGTNNGSTYSFDNPLGDGGQYGSASRYFDGIDDGVAVSNSAFPTGDFSISCWAKRLTSNWRDIVTIWQGSGTERKIALMFSSASKFIFYYVSSSNVAYSVGNTTPTLSYDVWYHVGVTYENGVAAKLFVDGVEVDSETVNVPTLQSSVADLYFGNRDDPTPTFDHNGNIADVRIYDTALTGTDMYDLSRGDDFRTNLVGQWLTNRDDVDDYVGSNNGTNNGSTYSQDAPL